MPIERTEGPKSIGGEWIQEGRAARDTSLKEGSSRDEQDARGVTGRKG